MDVVVIIILLFLMTVILGVAFTLNISESPSPSPSPRVSVSSSPSPRVLVSPSPSPRVSVSSSSPPRVLASTCDIVSYIENSGNVVEVVPFNGIRTFDATQLCPALWRASPPGVFYGLPNRGNYRIFNSVNELPNWDEVMQGGIGDCNLDSLLSLVAYKIPQYIKDGIVRDPNEEHVYYVRLHYKTFDNPFYVRISALLPLLSDNDGAYDLFYKENGIPVIWSYLYSKAYVVMTNYFDDFMLWNGSGYNTLNGVDGWTVQKAIAGVRNTYWEDLNNQNMVYIKNYLKDSNYIFQCGVSYWKITALQYNPQTSRYAHSNEQLIYIYKFPGGVKTLEHVLISYHAYSVFGISDDETKVTIRNPWGECTLDDSLLAVRENRPTQRITYRNGLVDLNYIDFVLCFNTWFAVLR